MIAASYKRWSYALRQLLLRETVMVWFFGVARVLDQFDQSEHRISLKP